MTCTRPYRSASQSRNYSRSSSRAGGQAGHRGEREKARYIQEGYAMPYIPDRKTYKAVMQACENIQRHGFSKEEIEAAARAYGADPGMVHHHVSQRASWKSRVQNRDPAWDPRHYY